MLLRFDGRHIRSYKAKDDFLSFARFEDELEPLAPYLFAHSTDITISHNTLQKCYALVKAPRYTLRVFHSNELKIVFQNQICSLSEERLSFWKEKFAHISDKATLFELLNLRGRAQEMLQDFLDELGLVFPQEFFLLDVIYEKQYIYIPFEFLSQRFIAKHIVPKTTPKPNISPRSFGMFFDPDLEASYPESLKVLELLQLRRLVLDQQNPDILFVSAHGHIQDGEAHLVNETLEEIVKDLAPVLTVFNSCLLAREERGILSLILEKGGDVIASPFYVPMEKTIFPIFLRFFVREGDFFEIFALASLFNPRLAKYFRYITTKTPS
ncbi:MAG: hypothetical protein ACRCS8_03625 [Brevinema sp.]